MWRKPSRVISIYTRSLLFACAMLVTYGARAADVGAYLPDLPGVVERGRFEFLISGWTWHNPTTYSAAERKTVNQWSIGLGLSRTFSRGDGVTEILYAQVFSDSIWKPQVASGYARTWDIAATKDVGVALGFATGITWRQDAFNGHPMPFVLPVLSVLLFDRVRIYGVYVPPLPRSLSDKAGNVGMIFSGIAF